MTKKQQLNTNRMRKRKCEVCREWFRPDVPDEGCKPAVVCSPECAIPFAKEKRAKEIRKTKQNTRQQDLSLRKEAAQKATNAYIRARDNKERRPCISCGYIWITPNIGRIQHAGHYESIAKRSDLRYNEDNIHLQCEVCNNGAKLSGNLAAYRVGLVKKIGVNRVLDLEENNVPRKYSIEELKEIEAYYKQKLKDLEDE